MMRHQIRTRACARAARFGLVLVLGLLAESAHAQPPEDHAADNHAADNHAAESARAQAAEHFDRGIAFFNEERFDAALAELGRAYALFPAYQTLYNLARVHAALGQAVEASRTYERYLAEAGDEIDQRRRREAERAMEEQRSRIGHLEVRTDVEGARIAIDGVDVATTPLDAPIPLSAGSHTVEVRAPGREAVRRAVAIAGQEQVALDVTLREEIIPRGTLRVVSALPEVTIAVDGEQVGVTPLPSTVPLRAGRHEVTATRRGYRTASRLVTIEDGAEAEVHFELQRDPDPAPDEVGRVRIALPNAPYLIRVDGEPMLGVDLELPVGAHRIELEVTDRQSYEGTLRVAAASHVTITPPLSWTLEARRARHESARVQHSAGLGLTIAGGALFAVGLPLLIWNEAEIAQNDQRILELNEDIQALDCARLPSGQCDSLISEGERLNARQDEQNVLRALTITGTVLGAVLTAIGIPLWVSAPSSDEIDAAARATLRLGPGGLELSGTFQ